VNDAPVVGEGEGSANLSDEIAHVLQRHGAFVFQVGVEGHPVHVRHDEVGELAFDRALDGGHEIGMGHLGRERRLPAEPGQPVGTEAHVRRQDLDRHPGAQLPVAGQEHGSHAPLADEGEDFVSALGGFLDFAGRNAVHTPPERG
jgi:hypothetical protein